MRAVPLPLRGGASRILILNSYILILKLNIKLIKSKKPVFYCISDWQIHPNQLNNWRLLLVEKKYPVFCD